jgi:hypothetical protein
VDKVSHVLNHFYHIYADGQWQTPLEEHIEALTESGLMGELTGFHIGLVGSPANRVEVLRRLDELNVRYAIAAEADSGWEQVTMNRLQQYAKDRPHGWVLYAHTKGSANLSPLNSNWRRSMTYYNIIRWRDIDFDDDVDTIGCHWCQDAFWGGTYWWAKAEYLASLDPPSMDSRFHAEIWIGTGKPKTHDLNPGWPAKELFTVEW